MRRTQRGHRLLFAVLATMLVASCSKSSPTEPAGLQDSITVVGIQPPVGTSLRAGTQVTFAATIGYQLSNASSGAVFIVIQDQSNKNLSLSVPQPSVNVKQGTGTVVIGDSVVVPASGVTSVNVIFALVPTGATSTRTTQGVSYPVTP